MEEKRTFYELRLLFVSVQTGCKPLRADFLLVALARSLVCNIALWIAFAAPPRAAARTVGRADDGRGEGTALPLLCGDGERAAGGAGSRFYRSQ